jgi:hypothetical protein
MRSSIASRITRSTSASRVGRRGSIPAHRRDGFRDGPRFASTTTAHVRQKKRAPCSCAPRGRSTATSIRVKHHARQTKDATRLGSIPAALASLFSPPHPKGCVSRRRGFDAPAPARRPTCKAHDIACGCPPFPCRPLVFVRPRIEIGSPGRSSAPGAREVAEPEGHDPRVAQAARSRCSDVAGVARVGRHHDEVSEDPRSWAKEIIESLHLIGERVAYFERILDPMKARRGRRAQRRPTSARSSSRRPHSNAHTRTS